MENIEKKWSKNCPKCGREQVYSCKSVLTTSIRKNTWCNECRFNERRKFNSETLEKVCPKCRKLMKYNSYLVYKRSVNEGWKCNRCAATESAKFIDRSYQKTEEYRNKMSISCSGKKINNKTKEKLSLASKKQWLEKRDKMLDIMNSDEYKQKHINNSKNMWSDENKRKEIIKKRNTTESKNKWKKSAIPSFNSIEYKQKQKKLQKELLVLHPERVEDKKNQMIKMWKDKSSIFHTEKFRENLSNGTKKMWKNPKTRKKLYDALSKTKWIKVRSDNGQLELLEKWNRLGFHFEPNYQLHTDDFLCYVDGYDKEKNVVLEYDGYYHKKSTQKQKDLKRQQKIIEILKPKKFWRYNSINKTWNDILERSS